MAKKKSKFKTGPRKLKSRIDWPCTPIMRRPDSAPLHDNPIRRFREELRLNRTEFAKVVGFPENTLRAYERDDYAICPGGKRMGQLIQLAKNNKYPLSIFEVYAHVLTKKSQRIPDHFYEQRDDDGI